MTIYSDPTGPLLEYKEGFLKIEDLNPELKTRWRLSRFEMFKIGFRFIRGAMQ
jgi:hypothetical protein